MTNIVTSGSALHDLDSAGIDQILKFLHVIFVKTDLSQFFINLKEFIYTPGALEILLNEQTDKSEQDDVEMIESSSQDRVPSEKRVNKGGQKSIVQLFPSIIDIASEFLKQHGLAAQCRRRNDTGFSSGVTINQIRQHLLEKVQDYVSIISQNLQSEDLSRHLTNPTMQLRSIKVILMPE